MKYRESYINDDDFDETLGYDEPQDEPEDCDEDSYNDWCCEQSEKSYENWVESGWGYR